MSGYPHDPEEVDEGGRNPTQRHLDDEGPDDERPVAPEADEGETDRADEAPVS